MQARSGKFWNALARHPNLSFRGNSVFRRNSLMTASSARVSTVPLCCWVRTHGASEVIVNGPAAVPGLNDCFWLVNSQSANVIDRFRCNAGPGCAPYLTFNIDGQLRRKLTGSSRPDCRHTSIQTACSRRDIRVRVSTVSKVSSILPMRTPAIGRKRTSELLKNHHMVNKIFATLLNQNHLRHKFTGLLSEALLPN